MSFITTGYVLAISEFPLWKYTTNGSIQCFYNFVISQYDPQKVIWLILSDLDIDLNNPYKANSSLLYNTNQTIYVHNSTNPQTEILVFDHLKTRGLFSHLITLDINPGLWGIKIKEAFKIPHWTHLCTLHYSKNVKVLIDQSIIRDVSSYQHFFENEIKIAQSADFYITVSRSESVWIQTTVPKVKPFIYYPTKLWWSYNLNTIPRSFYLREQLRDKLLVLYVGRLTNQKGIQSMLKVRYPKNVHLVMMSSTAFGDDGIIENVKFYAKENPDHFTWIGPYYHDEKLDIIRQCDAVLCPSIFEPFGLVGLETLLFSNTILIASNVDGMQDYLIDGGFINCGTEVDTIQNSIEMFANMNQKTKEDIIEKGKKHAKSCIDLWSTVSQPIASPSINTEILSPPPILRN
jgi:glycosyltransferase involved in cell wall biosynthesis